MTARACAHCGASPAPFGYRAAGPLRDLPPARRSYTWVCAAHRAWAEDLQARNALPTPDEKAKP